ncbi:ACP phosphodiesterase [Hahella ganghwensis]|uniref:acyl carrier protein phosphodiesterase n=1 Tax=Hahella ganghwensis TaxID=286420 RepID=UPI000368A1F3|nr:ACP phosphodiesterase [Hahella ganghwensis]
MNFLAHLHLADHSDTHALGNLLGDFIKGRDMSHFPKHIAVGILLHRKIDHFTDTHSVNARIRTLFPTEYRRYSGICLDLFWDYFLSRHWQRFHPEDRQDWIARQYVILQRQISDAPDYSSRMEQVLPRMIRYDWLSAYADSENICQALDRIGQRLKKPIPLGDTAALLHQHDNTLEQAFLEMYPDVMDFAEKAAQQLCDYLNDRASQNESL